MLESLSVVVPVYNSERTLPVLLARLEPVLSASAESFEVILVDDASRDGSREVVRALSAHHPWIRGLELMRNFGQHNALLCGIREARGSVIVTLDDDLQNPPEEIPKLLDRLADDNDVVYGSAQQGRHGIWRNAASLITKIALKAAVGSDVVRHVSAFRAFRCELREAFAEYRSPDVSIDVLLSWGTNRFAWVEVEHDDRAAGSSNYTFATLLRHALIMTTGFSTLPLRLASLSGFACTLVGLCLLLFVVGRYLIEGTSVPGFPFLASMIALLSGAQLFALGIIGEYLAVVHSRATNRPAYVKAPEKREKTPDEAQRSDRSSEEARTTTRPRW